MWYPATVTVAPGAEPVSLAQAKIQTRVDSASFDTELGLLIKAARAHTEKRCGTRFASQTVLIKCDAFEDFSWLPEAPVTSIVSITYVDPAGATQTLSTDVYELRADGYEASIVLKFGQTWPSTQAGSRIAVTAVVGSAVAPDDVLHAMLLMIGHWYENKEAVNIGTAQPLAVPLTIDDLLVNHRR